MFGSSSFAQVPFASTAVTASGNIYNVSIDEVANASDVSAAVAFYLSLLAESGAASDVLTTKLAYRSFLAESGAIFDTPTTQQIFPTFISEPGVSVLGAPSAQQIFRAFVLAPGAAALDTLNVQQNFNSVVSEPGVAALDAASAAQAFSSLALVQGTAQDSTSAGQEAQSNVAEQGTVAGAASSSQIFVASVSAEQASGADALFAAQGFATSISEQASGGDSVLSAQTFVSSIADTASGDEAVVSSFTVGSNTLEQGQGQVSLAATFTVHGDVTEQVQGTEDVLPLAVFGSAIAEQGAVDDALVATRVYFRNVLDTAELLAGSEVSQTFNVQVWAGDGEPVSITQYTSTLPLGTSFTGAQIFDSSSAGGGLEVVASGSGTGSSGGFIAGGNYILFSGNNTRSVKTIPLEFTPGSSVDFYMIKGNSSNGGEQPDLREDIALYYSTNGGSTYTLIATVITGGVSPAYPSFTLFSIPLPAGATSVPTILKWEQSNSSASTFDNYGLKDISVVTGSPSSVRFSDVSTVAASIYNPSLVQNARGDDALFSARSLNPLLAETAVATDSVLTSAVFVASLTNLVTAASIPTAYQQFVTTVNELGLSSDIISAAQVFARALSDAAGSLDSPVGYIAFPAVVDELSSYADQISAQHIANRRIDESVAPLDLVSPPGSIYNPVVPDTARAVDTLTTSAVFNSDVQETLTAFDLLFARYLWELIDDSQHPVWGALATAQDPVWSKIDNAQPASWQNIPTAQPDNWTDIDSNQDPNWGQIDT